jgi:hypothetical protein
MPILRRCHSQKLQKAPKANGNLPIQRISMRQESVTIDMQCDDTSFG